MSWSETSQRELLAAVLWSLSLAVGVLMHSTTVQGGPEEEGDSTGATTETSPTGTGGTTETSIGTTIGFVVILLILVLAVLVTVLLCVRQGLCACPFQKQPTPATPSARPPSRASRTSILSSSLRGNQRQMQSPNPMYSYHSNHHHSHHHQHHHHQQYSPHSCDNGHPSSPHNMHPLSGSRPLTMDLSYGQTTSLAAGLTHSHRHLSSSVESPPPHVSPYPGMPFPYQPCKSPPNPYCSNGSGFAIQSQVPRTPTSASITTLSSLSTMQNQRHSHGAAGVGGGGGGGEGERERGVGRGGQGGGGAEEGGRREGEGGRRGGSEGEGTRGRGGVEKGGEGGGGRGGEGGREREEVQAQRQVESIHSDSPPVPYTTQV